jgi:hypothetical protein
MIGLSPFGDEIGLENCPELGDTKCVNYLHKKIAGAAAKCDFLENAGSLSAKAKQLRDTMLDFKREQFGRDVVPGVICQHGTAPVSLVIGTCWYGSNVCR